MESTNSGLNGQATRLPSSLFSSQAQKFLHERGLDDAELMSKCDIFELSPDQMKHVADIPWAALRIPYTAEFARYRFIPNGNHEIREENPVGAKLPKVPKQTRVKKRENGDDKLIELRYWQPAHSGVHLYLPRLIDWPAVMADYRRELIIAEGEFKAVSAIHILDIAACGIGGVWNWKPADGLILPEFDRFTWRDPEAPPYDFSYGRTVYLVLDSDVRRRSDLRNARDLLAWQLGDRGANVRIINLPETLTEYARKAA
jgi:hypothetical protein